MYEDGSRWVTLEDGQHVLLGSDGTIRAGLGGGFNGKTFAEAFSKENSDTPTASASNGLSSSFYNDGRSSITATNHGSEERFSAMKESKNFKRPAVNEKSLDNLLGKEYVSVKGQDAIDKLMEEKQGHVKGAFYRDDIGEIDLFWGDDTAGLSHIISQRRKDNININQLLKELPTVIAHGKLGANANSANRANIYYKDKVVVVTYELRGEETTAVLTAFKTNKKA